MASELFSEYYVTTDACETDDMKLVLNTCSGGTTWHETVSLKIPGRIPAGASHYRRSCEHS